MERVLPKQRCEGLKYTVRCIRDPNSPSTITAIIHTASFASGGGCLELLGCGRGPFSCTGMLLGGVRAQGQLSLVDKSPGISSLWITTCTVSYATLMSCLPLMLATVPGMQSSAVNLLGDVSIINMNGLETDATQAKHQLSRENAHPCSVSIQMS